MDISIGPTVASCFVDEFPADRADSPDGGSAALIGANWYRFRAGESVSHARVMSVCFLWVLQGRGLVRSRGSEFRLDAGSILRLPWQHDVAYAADERTPFHVGTAHVVPRHRHDHPVAAHVPHRAGDPLLDAPWRTGAPEEEPRLLPAASIAGQRIISLASYAVERFLEGAPSEESLRALGVLLADADAAAAAEPASLQPVALRAMIDHVVEHLDRAPDVAEIAAIGGCSVTTAERLFARYTGTSVLAWARRRQLDEAALLLRTTSLSVGEVARRTGFADPLYFSRVFRAAFSVPPSRYATDRLRP